MSPENASLMTLPSVQTEQEPALQADDPSLLHRVLDRTERPVGIVLGTLLEADTQGHAMVVVEPLGIVRVTQSLVPLTATFIGRRVALNFGQDPAQSPLVLGFLWHANDVSPAATQDEPVLSGPREALIDGQRVRLEAHEEIELRCGEAAIVLHADGRIQLRGTYITSEASATQRILGGSVNVN